MALADPNIQIRPIAADDRNAVMSVARLLHGPEGWFSQNGLDHLAIDIQFQPGWVAVADGGIVGFLTYFVSEGIGHIGWMAVVPTRHRQGIGRRLVEQFERTMRESGIGQLQVYTLGDSVDYEPYARTRAFYRAVGFVDYRRETLDNPECTEALYLRKTIPPPPKLRFATNADSTAVKALIFGVLAEYGLKPDPACTDADLDDLEANYANRGGSFSVLEDDGAIIGSVGIHPVGDAVCELRKMYLSRHRRGRGIGRGLLDHALAEARRLGFRRVVLETASVLTEAIALYERYGFRPYKPAHLAKRCDQAYCLELT